MVEGYLFTCLGALQREFEYPRKGIEDILHFRKEKFSGDLSSMVPPLPIPNREVKRTSAYDTGFVLGQWVIAR